jgi:hypothetical protein
MRPHDMVSILAIDLIRCEKAKDGGDTRFFSGVGKKNPGEVAASGVRSRRGGNYIWR